MDLLVLFLKEGTFPDKKGEVDKVRGKAPHFQLSEEQKLYKRSFSRPYLLCVHPEVVEPLLEELHEGICGSHIGGMSLSHRALTQGYWWPNMQKEVQEYVKNCDQCQRFAPNIHQPEGVLNLQFSLWPFAQWGLDIVRPFSKAVGNRRWLLVGIDYFTKWMEAEPLSNIRDLDAKKFVWKNIVTWFGIPYTLISGNGLQFNNKAFRRYCYESCHLLFLLLYGVHLIHLNIKQNLDNVLFLGPHTLSKLLFPILLNVKRNLGHAQFLRPHILGKLTLLIYLNVKPNLGRAWFLGLHTLGKLTLLIYLNVKWNLSYAWFLRPHTFGKLTFPIYLSIKQNLGHV